MWGEELVAVTPFALLSRCFWCTEELTVGERGGRSWSVVPSWNFRACLVTLFQKWEGNFWQSNGVELFVKERGPDTDPTVPDAGNRSPWQRRRWHTVKLGLQTGDTGCIRYAGQPSHWDHVQRGKKKHLSAFAFFQQHAKNSSAGTEQGKADYTFWLMVPYTFREISYRSLIYLHISSSDSPRAKPWTQTPQAFRKFGRGSEFSPINCLVPILPLTVNLFPAPISCSLRALLNKPSPE